MPETAAHGARSLTADRPSRVPPRLTAALVSLGCLAVGALIVLLVLGSTAEQYGDAGLQKLTLFIIVDLLIGATACIAAGPIRRSATGNALLVVAGVVSAFALPAWFVAVRRLGERRSLRIDAAVLIGSTLGITGMTLWQDAVLGIRSNDIRLIVLITAVITLAVLLWGRVRGTRAALITALRAQGASAERARQAVEATRDADLARARTEERQAIARDMHDGVSHSLAVVAMHAGALASRDDLTPQQVRSAASTIRDASANAGEMIRESLTALRETGHGDSAAPPPYAATLDELISAHRGRGTDISLHKRPGTGAELHAHPAQWTTLARILDELLTNAARHAPGAAVSVSVGVVESVEPVEPVEPGQSCGALSLRVTNPSAPDGAVRASRGSGHGLIGVAERARLLGGSVSHEAAPDGSFAVEVTLPWQ